MHGLIACVQIPRALCLLSGIEDLIVISHLPPSTISAHIGSHMDKHKAAGKDVSWHIHDERSLLALQGPLAAPSLQKLVSDDLATMAFSDFKILPINGVECFLTRTG